jgi:hypothetical protein
VPRPVPFLCLPDAARRARSAPRPLPFLRRSVAAKRRRSPALSVCRFSVVLAVATRARGAVGEARHLPPRRLCACILLCASSLAHVCTAAVRSVTVGCETTSSQTPFAPWRVHTPRHRAVIGCRRYGRCGSHDAHVAALLVCGARPCCGAHAFLAATSATSTATYRRPTL